MRTFKNMAAQGDFQIISRSLYEKMTGKKFPSFSDLEKQKANHGDTKYTVAHSETGHDHVMELEHVEIYKDPKTSERDLYELFCLVKQDTPIEHLRSFDTHETLLVPPGEYIIKRQREYVAEGFRRAAD
jgi:hypothetical protein